jgi:hypothetical protein
MVEDARMFRSCALVFALLAACDGGPVDIHAIHSCDDGWKRNGFTDCEAACVASSVALGAMGTACQATDVAGPVSCGKTFVFHGVTGCCASMPPQVLFAECD